MKETALVIMAAGIGSRFYLPWCLHRSRGSGIFPDGTGPERRNPVFDDVKI